MTDPLLWLWAGVSVVTALGVAWMAFRPKDDASASIDRLERALRDEMLRHAQATRGDLATFQQMLLTQSGDVARTQNEQIDAFRVQLSATQASISQSLSQATQSLAAQAQVAREAQDVAMRRLGQAVEQRLTVLQEGNEKKLEQMRATVDEKLHDTLENRLGERFREVAERLEQVHKGLGEMQSLARDVGSLNRVLTNVKTRGIYGEVQLGALLEQVFVPDQYESNVETVPGSGARVEFALKLPGKRDDGQPLWLPIDAKFPREDYEHLLEAIEAGDPPLISRFRKQLENRIKGNAKDIKDKYINPPRTTDFAILFVPTESLYAEILRQPGLFEYLQRECHVTLAGPTTFSAILNAFRMNFHSLALAQKTSEVWRVLSAVRTEFGKYNKVVSALDRQLRTASNSVENLGKRTKAMDRKLRAVELLPNDGSAEKLLGLEEADIADDDDASAEEILAVTSSGVIPAQAPGD